MIDENPDQSHDPGSIWHVPDQEHPTHENMFDFFDTIHCDNACGIYLLAAIVTFYSHLTMMMGPMGGWADGSLLLLGLSAFTGGAFANSVMLAMDIDWYWHHASINLRFLAYLFATFASSSWLAAVLGEGWKMRAQKTLAATTKEMMIA